MNFLKININYSNMHKDFFSKKKLHNNTYEEILNLYFNENYWPSNSLELALKKKYQWKCTSLIYCYEQTNLQDIIFQKWFKENNIEELDYSYEQKLLIQIAFYKPDILYIHELVLFNSNFYKKIRFLLPNTIIIGWSCSPSVRTNYSMLHLVDLVYTCSRNTVDILKQNNINVKYLSHVFDSSKFTKNYNKNKYDVVFAGTIDRKEYPSRNKLLLYLIKKGIKISIFGNCKDPQLKRYTHPSIYGKEYYNILNQSKIVLNKHILDDTDFSGNIRLFETTGIGTFLLSDYKKDMKTKFNIKDEVILYKNKYDATVKIKKYLKNNIKREKIASKAKWKTMRKYSYKNNAEIIYNDIKKLQENPISIEKKLNALLIKKPMNNYNFSVQLNTTLLQIKELNNKNARLAIYGNGNIYDIFKSYLENIIVVCDQKTLPNKNNKNICHPSELNNFDFDYILILVLGREKEIIDYLIKKIKIDKKKIITIGNSFLKER